MCNLYSETKGQAAIRADSHFRRPALAQLFASKADA